MRRMLRDCVFSVMLAAIIPAHPTIAVETPGTPDAIENPVPFPGLHFKLDFGAVMGAPPLRDVSEVRIGALADPPPSAVATAISSDPVTRANAEATTPIAQAKVPNEAFTPPPAVTLPGYEFKLDFGSVAALPSQRDAADIRYAMFADLVSAAGEPASAPPTEPAEAAEPPAAAPPSATEIAKKLQNPVANLISVPIQWNINTGVGPDKQDQNIINVQPVIPFHITKEWNLITRTIIPIISTPVPDWEAGLGDIQFSLFASPAAPSKFIWGAGPIFQFPTATDDALGQGKWCAGPTAVGLFMDGPWVAGTLVNNVWSFAGDDDRADVNQMLVQPFVNYNFEEGWYASFSPIITANWEESSDEAWTVPLGVGIGKVFKIGGQIMNAQIAPYYNVVSPDEGPEWTIRFQLTFVFPTR